MPFLTTGMILTTDVVSREVISSTTSSIYNLLSGINAFDLQHVNQLLEELHTIEDGDRNWHRSLMKFVIKIF